MRALLADEMFKIKGHQRQHRPSNPKDTSTHRLQHSDLDNVVSTAQEERTTSSASFHDEPLVSPTEGKLESYVLARKPLHTDKQLLDALGIISANEDLLVRVLQDPGSPLAHHFHSQQALSARRGLVKSETFPLPGASSKKIGPNNKPSRLKPLVEDRVVIKRFKDLRHRIKDVIREGKREMHRVAMDAIIHKIPRGQNIGVKESEPSDHWLSKNRPKARRMRKSASFNGSSLDRYRQLYETGSTPREVKPQICSERVAPKQFSRIYSLPDFKAYDLDQQNDEPFDAFSSGMAIQGEKECDTHAGNSFDEQKGRGFPSLDEEDLEEIDNEIQCDSREPAILVGEVSYEQQEQEVMEKQQMCEISVNAKDRAEFKYVKEILEASGLSGEGLPGTWHSDDQPVNPTVYDWFGDGGGGEKSCYHALMFDLINEVLMEIYERSYTYYPSPLSHLSRKAPIPKGQHVLSQVWALVSFYLSVTPEEGDDHSLDSVLERDLAKSGWWMNLQFESECVGLQLEDIIFHDLLEQALSD